MCKSIFMSASQRVHGPLYFYIRQNSECTLHSLLSFVAASLLQSPYQKASCSRENCRLSLPRPSCKRAVWVEVVEGTQGNTSLRQSLLDSNTNTLPCQALSVWASCLFSCTLLLLLLLLSILHFYSNSHSPMSSRYDWHVSESIFMYSLSSLFISVFTFFRSTLTPLQSVILVSACVMCVPVPL